MRTLLNFTVFKFLCVIRIKNCTEFNWDPTCFSKIIMARSKISNMRFEVKNSKLFQYFLIHIYFILDLIYNYSMKYLVSQKDLIFFIFGLLNAHHTYINIHM